MVLGAIPNAGANLILGNASAIARAVQWRESIARSSLPAEYVLVGAKSKLLAEAINLNPTAQRLLSQTVFLQPHRDFGHQPSPETASLLAILEKILLRGRLPFPSLAVEKHAIESNGLVERVIDLEPLGAELGWAWRNNAGDWSEAALLERDPFRSCLELTAEPGTINARLDSVHEQEFIALVASEDPALPHWLLPQVRFANLVNNPPINAGEDRRVDFIFCHPRLAHTMVIEIDGPDHEAAVDNARDNQLSNAGYAVMRIPNSEVAAGDGPQLREVLLRLRTVIQPPPDRHSEAWRAGRFALECSWGTKFQLAIIKALQATLLPIAGDRWNIRVSSPFASTLPALEDLLRLLDSVGHLYSTAISPSEVYVDFLGAPPALLTRVNDNWTCQVPEDLPLPAHFDATIYLEPTTGPWGAYPQGTVDLLVRPAFLPKDLAPTALRRTNNLRCTNDNLQFVEPALTHVLQAVFRKKAFREGQATAVHHALRGTDSIVLLPTGGGKSIIYQLSSLLSPGITLVIDPLVSLIEDQIRGLNDYGVDRAVGFSSALGTAAEVQDQLLATERGSFLYVLVAPERMQAPRFRTSLRAMAHATHITLAVVDEAHCVSEWGHDFRPAYLNLARNLRALNGGLAPPPTILALTGTASRAVLRDMLSDLDLGTHNHIPIVRPTSFNRIELTFRVIQTTRANIEHDLRGVLNSLPQDFNVAHAQFYTPAAHRTYSGLIFTTAANGLNGVSALKDKITNATDSIVTIYSSSRPQNYLGDDWGTERRRNANQFLTNQAVVMVATKAFGMGIDKPNVRYTIHYGMPGSIEGFYQEAGRAGRDRNAAQCLVLFCRPDAQIEADLNIRNLNYQDALAAYSRIPRFSGGDVGSALFFHFKAFQGMQDETDAVSERLEALGPLLPDQTRTFPLAQTEDKKKRAEKALFRLVQIGILKDYELDYGANTIKVFGGLRDPHLIADRITEYISRTDRGRVTAVAAQLSPLRVQPATNQLVADLCSVLIKFCYDTIELARRRSIFEAMEAARQGQNPGWFRQRLLDYLQEGMDPTTLQNLLDADSIDFTAAQAIIAQINSSMEAGELRGTTIRFLESYPAHPLLLLLRAASESLSADCDLAVVISLLANMFSSAPAQYAVDTLGLESAVTTIAGIAEQQQSVTLFTALLLAGSDTQYFADIPPAQFEALAQQGLALGSETLAEVILCLRFRAGVTALQTAANLITLR